MLNDGQAGQDVAVPAGHAYAGQAVGTGGAGSPMNPALGTVAAAGAPFILGTLSFRDEFSRGGGGGGFLLGGGAAAVPTIPPPAVTQPNNGPGVAGGAAFPLLPFPANPPAGYGSLQHYLVGGAGGGGGGCHTFGIASVFTDQFMAGHGGSGGGGAIALRAGGDLTVNGSITARGGLGVAINGDNLASITQDNDLGISSPGGGGSGGSVVLQAASTLSVTGALDTSGGAGSRVTGVATPLAPPPVSALSVQAHGGAGATGFYRLEAGNGVVFTGSGVPAYSAPVNSGVLSDQDARTGSRSTWLLPATTALPVYLRYELVVDVAGQTLLFSDDPAVSPLAANSPTGPVQLRFQSGVVNPGSGAVAPNGPWRTQLAPGAGSLNGDRAKALRFDLVLDRTQGAVSVRELRVLWR